MKNRELEEMTNAELIYIGSDEQIDPMWRRKADKIVAQREWESREQKQTEFVVGCLKRRGYKVTVTNKIVAESEDHQLIMYLSDSSLVFENEDCICIDDFLCG